MPSHLLEGRNLGAPGQKQIHDQAAACVYLFRLGLHYQAISYRVGAGRGELGAGTGGHFHQTEAATAVRFQAFLITESGDVDA